MSFIARNKVVCASIILFLQKYAAKVDCLGYAVTASLRPAFQAKTGPAGRRSEVAGTARRGYAWYNASKPFCDNYLHG